ncbi:hypothetical protein WJX73_002193 [Symbiochloris irregularis]|uniref:Serine/threonine specific protein phosphatases domain-containing protein n=1 Tax=Symbiochloris irregularis TaxID=706552 RepID=A0AAW1PZV9_9CHLO
MGLESICLPEGDITPGWVCKFAETLVKASWLGHQSLANVLSAGTATALLQRLSRLLSARPPLVQVSPKEDETVTVVGDTHGQLHDVMVMFASAGMPSEKAHFIFNGDYVDRGSWGLESELKAKYPEKEAGSIYKAAEAVFIALPLAACVAGTTLVLHGGLFRPTTKQKRKGKRQKCLTPGSLKDLTDPVFKPSADPCGTGLTRTPGDILWSDPVATPGMRLNKFRGVGLVFGPDITEAFLAANNLRLIIRSHEGPDARYEIEDDAMNMKMGYTRDHITPNGDLVTVFSAPDYPQHQACPEEDRYHNLAAVAVLRGSTAPSWADPEFLQSMASWHKF